MGCVEYVRSLTKTNKMKSQDSKALWATQTEKPIHYTYVTVIRVVIGYSEMKIMILWCSVAAVWLMCKFFPDI